MRVIKFFIISLLSLIVASFLFVFVGREFFLLLAKTNLKRDHQTIAKEVYASSCYQQFGENQNYWTQIRFISDRDYNLEVVCEDFDQQPILIEAKKLPLFVHKVSNTSGLVLNEENYPSYLDLSCFQRQMTVYVEDQSFHTTSLTKPDLDYQIGPATACEAVNYQCCNAESQSGQGTDFNQATDCPKSCYESCLQRPMILAFNSSPPVNDSRLVTIKSGLELEMSYVVGDSDAELFEGQIADEAEPSLMEKIQVLFDQEKDQNTVAVKPITVRVDYGDGQFFESNDLQQSLSHVYTCNSNLCLYEAEISAVDSKGIVSSENELAKIIVRVSNF